MSDKGKAKIEYLEENNWEFNNTFVCPHCEALATHEWMYAYDEIPYKGFLGGDKIKKRFFEQDNKQFIFALCPNKKCQKYSIWLGDELIYPDLSTIKPPNDDLNKEIKRLYNEARGVFNKSPRAACALLRLAIEDLCKKLGATDDNLPSGEKRLKDRIKFLVKEKGLSIGIQEAFDNVRLTGNEALHTAEINLSDNKDIAILLFDMINIIADEMITKEKKIKSLRKIVTKAKPKNTE